MKRKSIYVGLICLTVAAVVNTFGQGASVPATRLQTRYSGLSAPIFLTHAGDGSKRIFIVERQGVVRVAQPGSNTSTVFLNITTLTSTDGEGGLLSIAFHPQYETNRRFFAYYTTPVAAGGDIRISEFEADPANPNVALTAAKTIITVPHPVNSNHNGGTLAFGPDGYLYAGPGDGGSGNDPPNNAQNINSLLGKMIRLDINNVPPTQTPQYNIPPTNPYAGATAGADEIYAVGLRNPYRWSFDRGGTGQLWLADVGQGALEEVDIITLGGNFGWRVYEGTQCTGLNAPLCIPANFIPPVFQYDSTGSRCSITGGYVYRGGLGTLPNGSYIYGDYCTGEVLLWHGGQQLPLFDIVDFNLTSFGEDEDGELYVLQLGTGIIQKIVPTKASSDFDGDFRTDLSVFRPSNGTWYLRNAVTGSIRVSEFGINGDIPVGEDFDNDRRADLAVFRPSNGNWYYFNSGEQTFRIVTWGEAGDIPAAGDYDGDGRSDFMLFRPSTGVWYLRKSSDDGLAAASWGANGDIPVAGDYDGDGRYDIAVWRPSNGTWYSINSTNNGIRVNQYGVLNDIPTTGDFDGDGRNDLAIFRPSTGQWFQKFSNNTFAVTSWGASGDVPVPGDYDNDNRDDIAVFRAASGTWFVIGSTAGLLQYPNWGTTGDLPIPNRDTP